MLQYLRNMNWLRGVSEPETSRHLVGFRLYLEDLHVGTLLYRDGEWNFTYSDDFRNQHEFPPIVDFPHKNRSYRNKELWPFFALRIPSVNQHAVKQYMAKEQVQSPSLLELMRKFGKYSAANPYVLMEDSQSLVAVS